MKRWLEELLWETRGSSGSEVLRIKGIVHAKVNGEVISHVVQAVRELYEIGEGLPLPAAAANPVSRLVFIGRQIDKDGLQAAFSMSVSEMVY